MSALVDSIEFRARSPKQRLPGLEEARAGLRALNAELDALNGKLSGMSTFSVFKRTKAEIQSLLKESLNISQRIPVKDVAKVLGIPDVKDFQAFVQRWKATHRDLAKNYMSGSISNLEFSSGAKAAEITRKYLTSAQGRAKDQVAQLQSLLSGGGGGGKISGTFAAQLSGDIPLIIPANRIVATIGPGPIAVAGGGGGGGGAGSRGGGSGGGGGAAGAAPSGPLIRKVESSRPGKKPIIRSTYLQGIGQELEIAEKAGNEISRKLTTDAAKQQTEKFRQNFGKLKGTLQSEMSLPQQQRDYGRIAALREDAAANVRALIGSKTGSQFRAMGGGPLLAQMESFATTQTARAAADKQRGMVADAQKVFRIREELAKARERGDRDEAARLNSERRQMEKRISSQNRMLAAGHKSDEQKAKQTAKVDAFNQAISDNAARRYVTHAAAERNIADFLKGGATITRESSRQVIGRNGPVNVRTVHAEQEIGGKVHTMTVRFDQAGASVERLTKQLTSARNEAGYLGADFLKNTAKVTLWAASVGVLYKSLELLKYSMAQVLQVGEQYQRLDQVFKKVGGSTMELTSDMLHLAAINGRSTEEAMQSALQWSRLGLTRAQVNEAVTVSMMAANDANISAEETTEKLQAVMQTYNLSIGQLRGTLGEIVQITNSYNVSTGDMLEGLSRTAAAAKQAGLPLAELMGLLGATVGATGQSGANIGNAIKSITLQLSNPAMQQKLRTDFRFESTTGGEEIKNMSALLADLYVKYIHLNDAQRQSLLFSVAGRTQANRLEALLDNYVKAQTLAINAQLNLNTAEEENKKIKAALSTQLRGLSAEWERFVVLQANHGPVQAMTQLAQALKNLLSIANAGKGILTTGILGLLFAGGAKTILTGLKLDGSGGFLGRTGKNIRSQMGALNNSMLDVYNNFMGGALATQLGPGNKNLGTFITSNVGNMTHGNLSLWRSGMARVLELSTRWQMSNNGLVRSLGNVTRALGVGMIALRQWALPMIAITLASVAFNRAMEAIGASSDAAERKLAGMNAEAQKSASAANAYSEAADALRTIQQALNPESGFPNIRPEDARRMLSQGSELMFQDEPDVGKREKMTSQMRQQLDLLLQQGRVQEIQNILEKRRNEYLDQRKQQLQEQFVAVKQSQGAMDSEIKRLQKADKGPFAFIGRESRRNEIAELQRRQEESSSDLTRISMEQNNAYEERLQYDIKHQTALERHKLVMQSISEIFNSIGTNNPFDKALVQMASLGAQLGAIQNRRKELAAQDDAELAGEHERKNEIAKLNEQEKGTREALMKNQKRMNELEAKKKSVGGIIDQKVQGAIGGETNTDIAEDDLNKQYGTLQRQLDDLERRKRDATSGRVARTEEGFVSRQKQREQLDEEERNLRAQLAATEQNLPNFARQMQFQFGQERARRDVTTYGYGMDETDRLIRERAMAQRELNGYEGRTDLTIEERGRQLELETQQYHNLLALRERAAEVEKDINQLVFDRAREMQRSLFEAGPNDLLRKLAAFRTAFDKNGNLRNVSQGQMLAMSPDFRREVASAQFVGVASGQRPTGTIFDAELIQLLNERNRAQPYSGKGGYSNSELDGALAGISQKLGVMADRLAKEIPDLFKLHGQALDNMSDKINQRVVPALDAFADRLDRISGGSSAPKASGQYGGTGGAVGNINKAALAGSVLPGS